MDGEMTFDNLIYIYIIFTLRENSSHKVVISIKTSRLMVLIFLGIDHLADSSECGTDNPKQSMGLVFLPTFTIKISESCG